MPTRPHPTPEPQADQARATPLEARLGARLRHLSRLAQECAEDAEDTRKSERERRDLIVRATALTDLHSWLTTDLEAAR